MGRLTTHVLDTAHGCPGQGIAVHLWRIDGTDRTLVAESVTNDDGRCDGPVLEGSDFTVGIYELCFGAGAYFEVRGADLPEPKFLDDVVIRFGIASPDEHYHVPLLISPFSYSTYRGS